MRGCRMDERSIMVLTGQAKKDYQREYMRKRSKKRRDNSGSKVKGLRVSDQDFTRLMATLPPGSSTVRVSKPGDADYEPQCETTEVHLEELKNHGEGLVIKDLEKCRHCGIDLPTLKQKRINLEACSNCQPKRGLDIKCFEDLPADVQETINQMCRIDDNKIDATAKANRTAIAIHYQHLFPGRY